MSCARLLADGGDIIAHVVSRQTEVFDKLYEIHPQSRSDNVGGKARWTPLSRTATCA
ncbi:MAG TPA: hypothetical protein VFZ67_02245 [Nitrososphaera sp.]